MYRGISLTARLILALSLLGACTKGGGKGTNNPTGEPGTNNGKVTLGGGPGVGGGSQPVREIEQKAFKRFNDAVADYEDAKAKGKFNDRCQKIASSFEDAWKSDKTLIEGLFNAGAVLLECGKTADAEKYFDKVLAQDPKYARALTSKGYLRYQEGKTSEARALFEQAVNADGFYGSVEARVDVATFLLEEYKKTRDPKFIGNDGAIGQLRRALAVDASSIHAYTVLALLYYHVNQDNLAELVCKQALEEVGKDYAPIYHVLGLVAARQKKVTLALRYFGDAISKDPNYVPSLMNVGLITIRYRDYKTAQEMFSKVVSLDPNNYEAVVALGVAYRGLGDYAKAEEQYLAAQKLDANHPSAYFNLGTLYQDYNISKPDYDKDPAKKFEEAKKYYQQFKSKAGSKPEWASFVKDADKRIKQCEDLIRVTRPTAASTNP